MRIYYRDSFVAFLFSRKMTSSITKSLYVLSAWTIQIMKNRCNLIRKIGRKKTISWESVIRDLFLANNVSINFREKIKNCLIILIEKLNVRRDKNSDKLHMIASNFSLRKKICRIVCKRWYGVQCRRTLYYERIKYLLHSRIQTEATLWIHLACVM